MQRVDIEIGGMSCGHCVASVRKALETVEGARVDHVEVGTATASYDPAVTSIDALESVIRDAGYEVAGSSPL